MTSEDLKLALIILLTGVVVVFSVLVLLILIIKLYSTAVNSAQSSIEKRKVEKIEVKTEPQPQEKEEPEAAQTEPDDGTVPGEIVAAIAAAVEVIFGEGAVTVTSVKRAKRAKTSSRRNAWKSAGVAENTRAF